MRFAVGFGMALLLGGCNSPERIPGPATVWLDAAPPAPAEPHRHSAPAAPTASALPAAKRPLSVLGKRLASCYGRMLAGHGPGPDFAPRLTMRLKLREGHRVANARVLVSSQPFEAFDTCVQRAFVGEVLRSGASGTEIDHPVIFVRH